MNRSVSETSMTLQGSRLGCYKLRGSLSTYCPKTTCRFSLLITSDNDDLMIAGPITCCAAICAAGNDASPLRRLCRGSGSCINASDIE